MPDKSNVYTLITQLEQTPSSDFIDRELQDCLIKFGSYVCISKNKILNQISMVVELIKDENLQKDFCQYFSCDSFSTGISLIFSYNPQLVKSKAVKDIIKTWKKRGI